MVLVSLVLALLWWVLVSKLCGLQTLTQSLQKASGHLLEIGLYKDQPKSIMGVLWAIIKHSLLLLKQLLLPCLVFLIPFVPLVGVVASTYSVRPPRLHESVNISYQDTQCDLEVPKGVKVEAGPITEARSEVTYWRLSASEPGSYALKFTPLDRPTRELTLVVGDGALKPKIWPFNSDVAVIHYPERELWLGDYNIHWAVPFVILFLIAASMTRRFFT